MGSVVEDATDKTDTELDEKDLSLKIKEDKGIVEGMEKDPKIDAKVLAKDRPQDSPIEELFSQSWKEGYTEEGDKVEKTYAQFCRSGDVDKGLKSRSGLGA